MGTLVSITITVYVTSGKEDLFEIGICRRKKIILKYIVSGKWQRNLQIDSALLE
jgi:hypothetical protein